MSFFNTGDTVAFQTKIKEQLVTDLRESQQELNDAILEESAMNVDHKRRKYLKENPKEVKSSKDKALCAKETSWYKGELERLKTARRAAKKEFDEATKALDAHKEDESKGFVRENDIQKVGNQYKATWTHLPR